MSDDRKNKPAYIPSISRRGFLASVGASAMTMAASGKLGASDPPPQSENSAANRTIKLTVNDRTHKLLVEPRWSLLYVLREQIGFTGTKVGCERGECGACTVLIDDIPHYSCLTLAVEAEGRKITTLEGLMDGEKLGNVQNAFLEKDAFQCGYCTPGQIMSVEGLLRNKPDPTGMEIRTAVSGNLCRCGTYTNIFDAAGQAAKLRKG